MDAYFTPSYGETHAYVLIRNLGKDVVKIVKGMNDAMGRMFGGRLTDEVMEIYRAYDAFMLCENEDEKADALELLFEAAEELKLILVVMHDSGEGNDEASMRVMDLLVSIEKELTKN